MNPRTNEERPVPLPTQERPFLLTLAGIQFAHILDFMVMMPLGPFLMAGLAIDTTQFGLLVAAYSFSAAACGLLAAGIVDRFDRKRLLLGIFAGFTLATLACGLASDYHGLLVARCLAGLFGGVMGSMVQTTLADAIPFSRRAAAGGIVATAFSLSTVAGVPASLWLAELGGWRLPFLLIAALSTGIGFAGLRWLPVQTAHLLGATHRHPLATILDALADANLRRALLFSASVILSGFIVIPYLTIYAVRNAGVDSHDIPAIYLAGGLTTLITARLIGRWADRRGKLPVFRRLAIAAMLPILLLTNMGEVGFWGWLPCSVAFFVLVSGRMIPAMALISGTAPTQRRGAALSLNATTQSLAMGLASMLGGLLVSEGANGRLLGYPSAGYLAVTCGLFSLFLAGRIIVRDVH